MKFELNGTTVRYANGGRDHNPDEPAVVLIHGAGMNRTVWQMQTRFLAHHGFRVAAIDLPGHGGTDGPAMDSVPEIGCWVADVVDALDLSPAHLVGHSMGTYIAIEAAAQRPETIASLVLVGTASAMPVHPELLDAAANDVPHASNLMSSWSFGTEAHIGRHATPGMWSIGASRALLDTSRPDSLGIDMAACNAYSTSLDAAATVACPVTFVLGSLDKMTPVKRATGLIDALSGEPSVVIVDGAGHMIMIEAPDDTRRAIFGALQRV
ncbi:MAG: alpha/beta hydrolase [Acidimicrobiaceae bacterium]|nr:alpha/beta hydrolase [Acidimicrobiaceae bacterium]